MIYVNEIEVSGTIGSILINIYLINTYWRDWIAFWKLPCSIDSSIAKNLRLNKINELLTIARLQNDYECWKMYGRII